MNKVCVEQLDELLVLYPHLRGKRSTSKRALITTKRESVQSNSPTREVLMLSAA